jgi:hypothetical protein
MTASCRIYSREPSLRHRAALPAIDVDPRIEAVQAIRLVAKEFVEGGAVGKFVDHRAAEPWRPAVVGERAAREAVARVLRDEVRAARVGLKKTEENSSLLRTIDVPSITESVSMSSLSRIAMKQLDWIPTL